MPPQLVHVCFPSTARPLIPALSQQAESTVPSFPSRVSPSSHLCALAASLQSQYHHGCWDVFSSALLLTGPGRTIIGVTGKKESPGTPETMEKERDPDSKPSGATESSSLFFQPRSQDCSEFPGNVLPFFIHLSSCLGLLAGLALKDLKKPQEALEFVSGTGGKCWYPQGAKGGNRHSWEEPAGLGRKEADGDIFVTRKHKDNPTGSLGTCVILQESRNFSDLLFPQLWNLRLELEEQFSSCVQ